MIKVGIVGCGAIGTYLTNEILTRYKNQVRLAGICDIDEKKAKSLKHSLKDRVSTYKLDALVKKCDLVIESAGVGAVKSVIEEAIASNTDVMIMSVGGLLRAPELLNRILKTKLKLYVPSGAIAGLDAVKAARMGKISSVKLITKKPAAGLADADYVIKNNIDLTNIKGEKIIFKGNALDAVAGFPKNINVAAVLSLAGIGPEKTEVCIVASTLVKRNIHTIEINGDFGKIVCCSENVPSLENPKTSELAMLSALAALDGIVRNIKVGT